MFRTPLSLFRVLAIAEAISWTLLIGALILRAVADLSVAVTVAGAIHGFVFLSYGATAVLVSMNQRWGAAPAVIAVVSAVVPYATVPVEVWLHRSGRLEGPWRLEEAPPQERAWYDRPMRWFLLRPWLLGGLIALAVIALYSALLLIGPPGGGH